MLLPKCKQPVTRASDCRKAHDRPPSKLHPSDDRLRQTFSFPVGGLGSGTAPGPFDLRLESPGKASSQRFTYRPLALRLPGLARSPPEGSARCGQSKFYVLWPAEEAGLRLWPV